MTLWSTVASTLRTRRRLSVAGISAAVLGPLLGAAYMLAMASWAGRAAALDEKEGGAQARQIDAVVHGPFGGEVHRMEMAIAAAAILVGVLLGVAASTLVALRDRVVVAPRPRSFARRMWSLAALIVGLHAGLELWAMARHPQLYAGAWYARGGWRRTVQLLATDVLGPRRTAYLVLLACAAYVAGPVARWREWPERASQATELLAARVEDWAMRSWGRRRTLALCLAVGVALSLFGASVAHTPAASARPASAARGSLSTRDPPRAPTSGAVRASNVAKRPNVLVIAADSLRADRLDPRTAPHLSALADRGTRFDSAYVSLPRTFPSWVTILTGRHPHHHGIRSMFPRWEERTRDFDAVPERLAGAGWSTGVVSDYAGDIFSRIDLGFGAVGVPEFDFRQLVRQRALEVETPLLPVLDSSLGRVAFPVLREMNDAADPSLLAASAVRRMRALEAQGPFFLVVFFSTAHFPYAAPAPYYRRFTDSSYRGRFKYHKPVGLGREAPPDERDETQVRALYDGAVLAIDDAAQSILDALESDGIADDTIVVVTADHGETLYDHGHGQGHGDHLFGDEGTHVPLVVVDPRHPRAAREDAIVRDVDIAPTLYALTGVSPPADLDGRSLVPALDGQPLPPALAYAETELWFTEEIPGLPSELRLPYPGIARLTEVDTQHGDQVVLEREMRPLTIMARHRMVRDERWKLIYVPTRRGVRWMLYDTRDDPGEVQDVAAAHPDVVARLQGELWLWMRRDPSMTERGGYLVPREVGEHGLGDDLGLVRLGDASGHGGT
ncbi:MAG TPA: sulfatase [Polyangiaceae bacterium]|jgi:arylsulfatase A-like enzyme